MENKNHPLIDYKIEKKISRLNYRLAVCRRRKNYLSLFRVLSFLMIITPLIVLWSSLLYGALAALPALILFIYLLILWNRFENHIRDIESSIEHLLHLKERINGNITKHKTKNIKDKNQQEDVKQPHPYANDLQIAGEFSLTSLLDGTQFAASREALLSLLCSQPDAVSINDTLWEERKNDIAWLERHPILRTRYLREAARYIREWGESPWSGQIEKVQTHKESLSSHSRKHIPHQLMIFFALFLTITTVLTYILFESGLSRPWYMITFPTQILFYFLFQVYLRYRKSEKSAAHLIQESQGSPAPLFYAMERLHPPKEYLKNFSIFNERPSVKLNSLSWMMGWISLRKNPLTHFIVGIFLLHEVSLTFYYSRWMSRWAASLPEWFYELHNLEALFALAEWNEHHPDWARPDLVLNKNKSSFYADEPVIVAEELRHPLIPKNLSVANSMELSPKHPIWLVTGSNMSGKSTFLRTVGLAVTLALVGSKVPAKKFKFQTLSLFTSMEQRDNLQESLSLFYAEVKRVKDMLDAAKHKNVPLLFLTDEMLRGTNTRERLIASRSILQELYRSGAAGLCATHDMELTDLAKESSFVLYHFQEEFSGDALSFDYKLKQGAVRTSNALALLRKEGIPITKE